MKPQNRTKASQGVEIWQRLEVLRTRLEAASMAFDDLYGYIYLLKADNRRRAEQVTKDIVGRGNTDAHF